MKSKGLALIIGLYLLLAAGYAAVTPFGAAPDETAHALYVQHLAERWSLPVLRRTRRVAYEFHQPPLYYLLAAPAWALTAPPARRVPDEAARGGKPGAPALSLRSCAAARAVSILIGAVGVWLIAALGWSIGPAEPRAREALALAAAGFTALLPMRLATAASVSNDMLAEAVFTAGLLVMARMVRDGLTQRGAVWLGVVLGLGILAKSSDLLLFPLAAAALLLASQGSGVRGQGSGGSVLAKEQSGRGERPEQEAVEAEPSLYDCPSNAWRLTSNACLTFGLALVIGGWWMVRNARLYGDPLGTRAFEQYFQDTYTPADLERALGYNWPELLGRKVLPLTFESFWGVFGHMRLFMGAYPKGAEAPAWAYLLADRGYPPPSWLYPWLLVATGVAAAGSGVQRFRGSGVRAFGRSGVEDSGGDRSLGGVRARASTRKSGGYPRARAGEPDTARRLPNTEQRSPGTRHPTPNTQRLILLLAGVLVFAAFLRFNTEFFQAQGRYLFPAMGPIAIGFAAGWLGWWPPWRRGTAAVLLVAGMLALALLALRGTLMPAFGYH